MGRLPAWPPPTISGGQEISGLQTFRYVQAPRPFLPLCVNPQGSRGFYVRAEHASFPPHASDMLVVRIQAIDGASTFTPPDSQPCRLLTTPLSRASCILI